MASNDKSTKRERRAVAGKCLTCGENTIRGIDQFGRVVEADRAELDAAHELDAHLYGRDTFALLWKGHMQLDTRATGDSITAPAGYRPNARILREHRCQLENEL